MISDIFIEPTTAADMPSIAAIADETGLFPSDMLPDMIAGYLGGASADIWLTASVGGASVGFAFCEPERLTDGCWNLLAIAVAPERQGLGLGGRILRHLEDRLRSDGQRILIVETLGTEPYGRTRAFYTQNGFVQEARIRDFYFPGGDKIVFWKALAPAASTDPPRETGP